MLRPHALTRRRHETEHLHRTAFPRSCMVLLRLHDLSIIAQSAVQMNVLMRRCDVQNKDNLD